MATKNAHVFASSSFGFGYILIFSNRKKEDNTTATTTTKRERRETRKAKKEEKKKKKMFCVSLSSSQKSFGAASCSFRASNRREDDDGRRHHRQSFWNGRRHATQKKKKMKMNTNTVAMGNVNDGGLFAPVVVALRPLVGVKRFNKLRGKVISLHSQLIGDFCTEFGATTKQRQKMIKTAKANGGKLGFLA